MSADLGCTMMPESTHLNLQRNLLQKLRISNERRVQPLADGVLAINARSEVVLHGLTLEESQFLMDFGDGSLSDKKAVDR